MSVESNISDGVGTTVYIAGGVVGGVSVFILIFLVSRHCRQQRHNHQRSSELPKTHRKTSRTNLSEDQTSVMLLTNQSPAAADLEIAPSSVRILQRIGNARFGTVYIGNVATSLVGSNRVIVKTLAGDADPLSREFFIARTRAMVGLRHCNVLGLVGACLQQTLQSGIISALYEYCDGVDLNTFLESERTLGRSSQQTAVLMKLAVDSACGLAYLTQHRLTHGDVASNNILVVTDAAGCAVAAKICDLGLTSPWCTGSGQHYRLSRLDSSAVWPQRTTAPELLLYGHVAVSEASDVWQFGFVLYQIYYVSGHQHLVAIVTDCCSNEPDRRPRFGDVHHRLLQVQAARVICDPVNDPVTDPIVDRLTGEVIWGSDPHTSSPDTSNGTGYSLLTVHPADTIIDRRQDDDDNALINRHHYHQQQQPCRRDKSQEMVDAQTGRDSHSTLPSSSSETSSHVVV